MTAGTLSKPGIYPPAASGVDAAPVAGYLARCNVPPPIVVGGTGGSGTRMVVQMLTGLGVQMGTRCNHAGDAEPFMPLYERFNNSYLGGQADLPLLRERLQHCMEEHRSGMPARAPWGWKNPRSIFLLPVLDQLIPGLRYVHVVRDGLAMVSSANQDQLVKHGHVVLPDSASRLPDPQRSLLLWAMVNAAAADYGATMEARYLRLRYEDMCSDPALATARLAALLGLPVPSPTASTAMDIRRPRTRDADTIPLGEGTSADGIVMDTLKRFNYPC
jgi:hypothetical protein